MPLDVQTRLPTVVALFTVATDMDAHTHKVVSDWSKFANFDLDNMEKLGRIDSFDRKDIHDLVFNQTRMMLTSLRPPVPPAVVSEMTVGIQTTHVLINFVVQLTV